MAEKKRKQTTLFAAWRLKKPVETRKQKKASESEAVYSLGMTVDSRLHGPTYSKHQESGGGGWSGFRKYRDDALNKQDKERTSLTYESIKPGSGVLLKAKHDEEKKDIDVGCVAKSEKKESSRHHHKVRKETESTIFSGVTCYFNGRTKVRGMGAYHLRKLVVMHGGKYSMHSHRDVTHVICSNLCGSKSLKVRDKLSTKHYVTGQWIVDSITNGKRLPESKYLAKLS